MTGTLTVREQSNSSKRTTYVDVTVQTQPLLFSKDVCHVFFNAKGVLFEVDLTQNVAFDGNNINFCGVYRPKPSYNLCTERALFDATLTIK